MTPWTVAHQVPLSMGFPRQEYWSELPGPPPGNLPNLAIEPASLVAPALQAGSFPCIPVISIYRKHFLPGFCSHLLPAHSSALPNTVSRRREVVDQYLHWGFSTPSSPEVSAWVLPAGHRCSFSNTFHYLLQGDL